MQSKIMFSPELSKATGQIRYGMTNDYMFRALFQKNTKALKGLLSSLLHIPPDEIISVQILNPIQIGSSIQSKEFRLDIKLLLNNQQQIDLEMQIENCNRKPKPLASCYASIHARPLRGGLMHFTTTYSHVLCSKCKVLLELLPKLLYMA